MNLENNLNKIKEIFNENKIDNKKEMLLSVNQILFLNSSKILISGENIILFYEKDNIFLDENLDIINNIKINEYKQFNNIYELYEKNIIKLKQIKNINENADLIKIIGVGMHFKINENENLNFNKFISILEKYNCHPKFAEKIALDLIDQGQRTTTVKYHLLEFWDKIQKDLNQIGIKIEHCHPFIQNSVEKNNIKEKVEALQKQYNR